jgi:hypothetical protein
MTMTWPVTHAVLLIVFIVDKYKLFVPFSIYSSVQLFIYEFILKYVCFLLHSNETGTYFDAVPKCNPFTSLTLAVLYTSVASSLFSV